MTNNPWETIRLSDYENHMQLHTVRQLQTLNEMMREQLSAWPVQSVMILGIAGGNGLEHVSREKYRAVYGVDVDIHSQIDAEELGRNVRAVGYDHLGTREYPLPNGKKLLQIDFERIEES